MLPSILHIKTTLKKYPNFSTKCVWVQDITLKKKVPKWQILGFSPTLWNMCVDNHSKENTTQI
jgi:hypothetical protein